MAVTTVGQYVFYYHPNLETVRTSATVIGNNAFNYATKLRIVDLVADSQITIGSTAFTNASSLTHFIIRSSSMAVLNATNIFDYTRVSRGLGAIYVPSNLVESYKTNSNWSAVANAIHPIGDYPIENFDTIKDSWATILAKSDPSSSYSIGDTKTLVLNANTSIVCQIAAFNTDVLASDSSKTALITWIMRDAYPDHTEKMKPAGTSLGGWEGSSLRTWLISDILPLLEASDVGASLQTVTKTYRTKHSTDTDTTKSCSDKIWIPSYKEVNGTNTTYVESDGVVYSGLFSNNKSRVKYNGMNGASVGWWLRSAYNTSNFSSVTNVGGLSYTTANSAQYFVFGFCTGAAS